MLYNQTAKKNKYVRPSEAMNYLQLGKVLTSETATNKEAMVKVPSIVKLRPLNHFNHYAEATSEGVQASGRVVCSGSLVYVTEGVDGTNVAGIGILKNDAQPGDIAAAYIEGSAWLPGYVLSDSMQDLETVGKGLAGQTAYWDVTNGNLADAADAAHVAIGTFTGQIKLDGANGASGSEIACCEVDLRLIEEETPVALPADAAFSAFSNEISLSVGFTGLSGLNQRIWVRAACNNPSAEIKPSNVYIEYDGGSAIYAESGFEIPFTAVAGALEPFDITVIATMPDGTTETRTQSYTATFSASAEPSVLAEV